MRLVDRSPLCPSPARPAAALAGRWNTAALAAAVTIVLVRCVVPLSWLAGWMPYSSRWVSRLVVIDSVLLLWAVYGWWVTRQPGWRWLSCVLVVGALWGGLMTVGQPGSATAVLGIASMSLCFVVGHWLIRTVLSPGIGVCGVARTVVDEAIRMRVVLILMIGLVLMVPVLPLVLDPGELLKYRMQLFLTWSLSSSAVVLSVMTGFLACGTICSEISRRHIFLTLTKPIGRGQYLLGKWLGIVLLDLLLVSIVGVGVYACARVLQQQPYRDQADRLAVDQQILVARHAVSAQPPAGMDTAAMVREHLEKLRRHAKSPPGIAAVRQAVAERWHTIPPRDSRIYLFRNLQRAKMFGPSVQLRFKPISSMTPPDKRVRLAIWLNGRPFPTDADRHLPVVVADNYYHVLDVPVTAMNDKGDLEVRIANVNLDDMKATFPSSIRLTPDHGLEVLYQVGRFEANLARAMALIWVRLSVLAMLGLAAGSFLGFPVACLLTMLVYAAAAANSFLLESMQHYVSFPTRHLPWWDRLIWVPGTFLSLVAQGHAWDGMKILIRLLGNTFVLLIPSFSDYDPVSLIADGRLVPYEMIGTAAIRIGLLWTGSCAMVGWLIFRRRELARVTV